MHEYQINILPQTIKTTYKLYFTDNYLNNPEQ